MAQNMSKRNLFTSNFKKNIIFFVKLALAFVIFFGYIYYVLPQYEQDYCASLIDKVDRLKSIDEPKIVLLGNSNLAFGINSELIEEAMGMPVVNMGFHAASGNAFHEEMSKYNIKPGDLYILCHSDYDDDNLIDDTMVAWSSIENHFELWKVLRLNDIETMARSFPVYLKKSLTLYSAGTGNQASNEIYARNAFNEYGDHARLREGCYYNFEEEVKAPNVGEITIDRINNLDQYLAARGADLVIAGYPIGNGCLTADAEEFITFQGQLANRLNCPVISNYADYMFDYQYFYNSDLHLNTEGVQLRTMQLIADLKRWQKTGSDSSMENDEYADIIADVNLSHVTDINLYLDALIQAQTRYTLIISAMNDDSFTISDEIYEKFSELGIKADCFQGFGGSYAAVIEQGNIVFENFGSEKIEATGSIDENRMVYSITNGDWEQSCCSSILLNGQEYSENVKGLNLVVYSNETHRILDEVTFEINSHQLTMIR